MNRSKIKERNRKKLKRTLYLKSLEVDEVKKVDVKKIDEKGKNMVDETLNINFSGLNVQASPSGTTTFKKNELMTEKLILAHPFSCSILGTTGSGKTMLLSYMLNNKDMYKGYFDKIIVFGRTIESDGTYKYIKKDKVISKDMTKELDDIVEKLDKESKTMEFEDRENLLIVFEDISSEKKLLKSDSFNKLMVTFRHYKTSIFTLSHYYKKLSPMVRLNVRGLMIFKCNSTQTDLLGEDFKIADRKAFTAMCQYSFTPTENNSHPFLFINQTDSKNKFRKSFTEYLDLTR
jgi:hypothetical protein